MTFAHRILAILWLTPLVVLLALPASAATLHHGQSARAPVALMKAGAVHRSKAHLVDPVARRQTSSIHQRPDALTRDTGATTHRAMGAA